MASSDVEHWQCDKTLPQCMGYMLDNQFMCDVTFLLGEERHEVHAHKYMLASRSPVFHAMLGGPMAERGKIEIPDIDKDTFKAFLRYVYTDDVSLTAGNVLQVMYASKKYCVDLLTNRCKDFVQDNITTESACLLMNGALTLQEEDIYKSCLEKIKENTESCIQSSTFTTISKEALKSITQLEDVLLKEEVLYEQVMKWCDAECGRQYIKATWENKRKLLGDILYNIRFPLMDSKYFAKKMIRSDLLTEKEKNEIMYYHIVRESTPSSSFNYSERHESPVQSVIRFPSYSDSCAQWYFYGSVAAIDFKTSHDSRLYGILVYGVYYDSCTYEIEINVKDSTGLLLTHKTQIGSYCYEEMHEIKFKEPVKVKANAIYCLELLMNGDFPSKRGVNGKSIVPYACGTKTVTFLESYSSTDGTFVDSGIIPGLLMA